MRRWVLTMLFPGLVLLQSAAIAQDSLHWRKKYPAIQRWQFGFHTGPIFAHSETVQNTSGARPRGVEFILAWQRNDPAVWNTCGCSPIQGLQFSYYDYDIELLGKSWNLSYLLEPTYRLSAQTSISFRSVIGLAYLTNPYDADTNPTNQSYSTTMSAYLALGTGFEWRFSQHASIGALLQYQHISNGGLRTPNKGINWPAAGVTVAYRPHPRPLQTFGRSVFQMNDVKNVMRWDLTLFGVGKRVAQPDGTSNRYLVMGLSVQAARRVGRINNLTLGTEVSWDNALGARLSEDFSDIHPWRAGLLVGHEFILGRFLFSQRLGVYVYQAGNYFDPVFHRWGLAYVFGKHWSGGVNLQAHRNVADYTDLRLTYFFY